MKWKMLSGFNMNSKIIVTGATGQLGRSLQATAPETGNYLFLSRNELSLSSPEKIDATLDKYNPSLIINCAAYTAVDKAEEEQETAYAINATAVAALAEYCSNNNTRLIHISTDYVFNGKKDSPYTETDSTNPINVYGTTKLKGEQLAMEILPSSLIIRTSWVYSPYGNNFVKTMLRLMESRNEITVVSDQVGTPTLALDLADAIHTIAGHTEWHPGIYHYSNMGTATWHEFATTIKELIGSACKVLPILSKDYPVKALRPQYSILEKAKIQSTFNLHIPEWKESLAKCLHLMGY